MSNMGDRIRFLRERAGMTQEELGEKLGIKKSAVAKYENGRVENIKRSSLKVMALVLGVSPCYLMFGDEGEDEGKEKGPALKNGPEVEELIRRFDDLPDDARQTVLSLVRTLSEYQRRDEGSRE